MNPVYPPDSHEALTFHPLPPIGIGRLHAFQTKEGIQEVFVAHQVPAEQSLDFDSDEPLACPARDQSGDTTCESCQ